MAAGRIRACHQLARHVALKQGARRGRVELDVAFQARRLVALRRLAHAAHRVDRAQLRQAVRVRCRQQAKVGQHPDAQQHHLAGVLGDRATHQVHCMVRLVAALASL